METAMRLVN